MSFSLVGPFSFGSKVSSAQFNQLDSDHASSLDKSVAGDQLQGVVTMAPTAAILVNNAGASIVSSVAGGIQSTLLQGIQSKIGGGIVSLIAAGITSATVGGIAPSAPGGITDGGVAGGIQATVAQGILATAAGSIQATVFAGISAGVARGIASGVARGIESETPGGIALNGGAPDYITYVTTRQVTRNVALAGPASTAGVSIGTGWSEGNINGAALIGGALTNVLLVPLNRMLSGDLNGSTLINATLVFAVGQSHSGVPAAMPGFNILRQATAATSAVSGISLFTGGFQTMASPGTGAAWYASGNMQNFATSVNQHNLIDLTSYVYYLFLVDESGSNALSGNYYFSLLLNFEGISNSAPG
jgi:hypothetical protein